MSAKDFEDAIDGIDLLLQECCRRLLSESFLYNAIKHGLSTIALDEEAQFARTLPNGEIVVGHRGPMFAYMHKARRPGPKKDGEREWFITMAGAKTERDLALSLLVANAIESLWMWPVAATRVGVVLFARSGNPLSRRSFTAY